MTPSLEGWPTRAKEAPSPHEVRLATLDTDPLFGPNSGSQQFWLRQSLDIMVSNHHVQYQKKLMIQS